MKRGILSALSLAVILVLAHGIARADLADVMKRGELRHLGVVYARFVTGSGDGFSTELVRRFAGELKVEYKYVNTTWQTVLTDLSGSAYRVEGDEVAITGDAPIRGDIVANGLTILPWRRKLIDFSTPTFPSGVWLIARADSTLQPIQPGGSIEKDIQATKDTLAGRSVLCMRGTCLDPDIYSLEKTRARLIPLEMNLNEFAPAIINNKAETSLLDVPDVMVALQKWPGRIKVIGPVSLPQEMGCGFAKNAPMLLKAFNEFLERFRASGEYARLVDKYYPGAPLYFPGFFKKYTPGER
ncbi:MAG: transporter substrate-binding domain-containing protein [Desulfobacterales bacterium]|nr:transporter substrate-binding domain-containing protein [Desulfobacterales bacterium]